MSKPIIRLEKLAKWYPEARGKLHVLKGVDLTIKEGEIVALVGQSGSGKSTMSKLIAGMIEPSSGAILIDGIDVRQIDPADVRTNIGVMLQDSWLFSGTIRENIQMGFVQYSDEHLLNVSKISGVDEFVRHNPAGYDFNLKERGEGLSGGQKQSINLARAILHNPALLILDEPTSSMDTATEKMIIDNLIDWSKDKTLVAITHRNSLVKVATRVIILDRGVIIADDTPDKLLGQKTT